MRELNQSAGSNVMVFMTDSADHITGLAGLALTITISKDGGVFGAIAPAPTVNDRGNGWYNVVLVAGHTDTLGELCLHITGVGADPSDIKMIVITPLATKANLDTTESNIRGADSDDLKDLSDEVAAIVVSVYNIRDVV